MSWQARSYDKILNINSVTGKHIFSAVYNVLREGLNRTSVLIVPRHARVVEIE